ncbi:protease complex subunit PrcB family protein [Brevibacillus sp. SYP-B805]|uniref:protease complex subunit PrcB family protein n=1 Tax=Brevibacillus sp. SYP-B805 TaxID=1578199 RepID=UPI0013EB1BCC|nr:protease complex subunit PrcB family protein [Brevibacillus sp. SYP-B805]NGQ94758.1 protease complex subunit PrcB family protein [Brevibacillus sp. SYP-B805]
MNAIFTLLFSISISLLGAPSATAPAAPAAAAQAGYEVIAAPYPAAVANGLRDIRTKGGHKVVTVDGKTYVAISLGQRSTGGYKAVVKAAVKQADGTWRIEVAETAPTDGQLVTQVITYPTVVIALPEAHAQVTVVP